MTLIDEYTPLLLRICLAILFPVQQFWHFPDFSRFKKGDDLSISESF